MVGFGGFERPSSVDSCWSVGRPNRSWIIGRRRPVCEDCAFVQSNRQEPTDDQADLSSAPAHDRRHDDAQFVAEHPRDIHPCGSAIQYVPPAISRQPRGRAFAGISPVPCIPRSFGQFHLREDERVEVLLPHDITAAGYRRLDQLPTVPAREEVKHLLKAVADLKLRTALITIYSAGLRISEAIRLTARDIDSARMVICVRQGKGGAGSLYGLIQATARHSSRLLAPYPAAALAVSRPQSITASDEARVATGVSAGGRGGWPQQVGHRPHVAT